MTKAALIVGVLFAGAACNVGSVAPNGQQAGVDAPAGGGGGGGGPTDATPSVGSDPTTFEAGTPVTRSQILEDAHIHSDGGGTKAGIDCMQCHGPGGAANIEFSVAGTMYGSDGVTPDPGGAWVLVQPGGTGPVTGIKTDKGGNFYWGPGEGEPALTLPAATCITASPTLNLMDDQVQAGQGGCNSCHSAGGGQGPIMLQPQ